VSRRLASRRVYPAGSPGLRKQIMAEQQHDLVMTYVVDQQGQTSDRRALDEALRNAYRIIEVICVPGPNCLYVTVVLTHDTYETVYGMKPTD
jgi:hypothetical protein